MASDLFMVSYGAIAGGISGTGTLSCWFCEVKLLGKEKVT